MKGLCGSFLLGSVLGIAVVVAVWIGGCSSDGITPVCPADSCITLPGDAGPPVPYAEVK